MTKDSSNFSQLDWQFPQAQNYSQSLSETQEGVNHSAAHSRRLTFLNARGLTRQEFEMARFKENVKSA
jgi:hypothetical protein